MGESDDILKDYIKKEELIDVLDMAIKATGQYDEFTTGFSNGLLYIKAVITDKEQTYFKVPDKTKKNGKPYYELVVCPVCNEIFPKHRIDHIYCSKKCWNKANKLRNEGY